MVIDNIVNGDRYFNLGIGIKKAIKFLQDTDLSSLKTGRYDLEGDSVYALVNVYDTKLQEEAYLEAHQNYIDVQYIVTGHEKMGYKQWCDQECVEPYDSGKDYGFYKGEPDFVIMEKNMFAIFFPDEMHMPGIMVTESQEVKKIVIKVLAKYNEI